MPKANYSTKGMTMSTNMAIPFSIFVNLCMKEDFANHISIIL